MHTIITRSPTPAELQLITGRTKLDIASWGCLTIFLGIAPAFFLGKLGGWLGGFISEDASTYCRWSGWALSAVLFIWSAVTFMPFERRARRRAAQDAREKAVEEIRVVDPRVIEIGLISDNEPILAFDIGDNRILLLQGQWLREADTYGTEGPEGDPFEEFINGLPAPHSFPSSEFTISRFPHSGEVLGIRVCGKYAAPEAEVEALKLEYEFGDSEILDGSLDDVAGVLAREHERRSTE
jgi:hypothetical protein